MQIETAARPTLYYGWKMVAACFVVASMAWSFGLFGASVYLPVISRSHGWPISLISSAVTCFYLVSALSAVFVGSSINRFGPRPIMLGGTLAMAAGVAAMGQVREPWQVYITFLTLGLGWASLSSTAISTALAPWFDKHQGRAISTALMGASVGGIVGVPALLFTIEQAGFATAVAGAGVLCLVILLPLVLTLRARPADLGLLPDGASQAQSMSSSRSEPTWTRRAAARTKMFRSVAVAFGLAFLVQVGFLTHHVAFLSPRLGDRGASLTVSATAIMAFLGRIVLARYVDRLAPRQVACGVFCLGAAALGILSVAASSAVALVIASLAYGLTVGNVTTLPSIIVRREFGAVSFGAVYGLVAMIIGLSTAIGPSFYGVLFDLSGSYRLPMLMAAALNCAAAGIILAWQRSSSVPHTA